MSTTLKILLGIAAVFVLLIGVAAWKGYSWWRANGRVYLAAIQASQRDGRSFGLTADNAACVKSALDRFGSDTTALGMMTGSSFVQACLPASKPTPGFCDGVPAPRDFSAMGEWSRKQCDEMSLKDARGCQAVVRGVPMFCHPRTRDTA